MYKLKKLIKIVFGKTKKLGEQSIPTRKIDIEKIRKYFKKINISNLNTILGEIGYFQDKIDFFENFHLSDGIYYLKNLSREQFIKIEKLFEKYNIELENLAFNCQQEENCAQVKINYACGSNLLKGWINVDFFDLNNKNNKNFYKKVNLVEKHPFKSNSFQFGFCEDFLEHLDQEDSIIFLAEVFRTLKPGGIVRLSFPGLEGVLKRHYMNKNDYISGKFEAYAFWDHKHFFSKDELTTIAKHIGYSEINLVEYGKSTYKELRNLDTRKEQIGLNTYAELRK